VKLHEGFTISSPVVLAEKDFGLCSFRPGVVLHAWFVRDVSLATSIRANRKSVVRMKDLLTSILRVLSFPHLPCSQLNRHQLIHSIIGSHPRGFKSYHYKDSTSNLLLYNWSRT